MTHSDLLAVSDYVNKLSRAGKTWEASHGFRYAHFARTGPNYEECAYTKKTGQLFERDEKERLLLDLQELKDNLDTIIATLKETS